MEVVEVEKPAIISFNSENFYENLLFFLSKLPQGKRLKVVSFSKFKIDKIKTEKGKSYTIIIDEVFNRLMLAEGDELPRLWFETVEEIKRVVEKKFGKRFFSYDSAQAVYFIEEEVMRKSFIPLMWEKGFYYAKSEVIEVDREKIPVDVSRDESGYIRVEVPISYIIVLFYSKL